MKNQLYAFFCTENCSNKKELIITIDNKLKSMQDIYYHIGKFIYYDYKYDNPIYPNDKFYFGHNVSGFYDCLTDYMELRNKEISLRFNIISKHSDIDDGEFYAFLGIFISATIDYEYEDRLRIFISKDIMKFYNDTSFKYWHLSIPEINF